MTSNHHDVDTSAEQKEQPYLEDQPDQDVENVAMIDDVPAVGNHYDDLEKKIMSKVFDSDNRTKPDDAALGAPTCSMVPLDTMNHKMHSGNVSEQAISDKALTEKCDIGIGSLTTSAKKCMMGMSMDKKCSDKFKENDYDMEKIDPEYAGLAVAVAVTEYEYSDDLFLPAAIEFDPETKKIEEEKSNRMSRRKIIIGIILIAVVVNSITFGIVLGTKKSATTSARMPAHPRMRVGILQFLESNFPSDVHHFRDSYHPLTKAMNWMTFDDPQLLVPSQNKTFLQRFVLVHLYFQTTQNNNWAYCYPNGTTANGNTTILTDTANTSFIYDRCFSFVYSKYDGLSRQRVSPKLWLSTRDVCDWAANECDSSGHITTVGAVGLGLNGPFPDKLNRLSFLRKLEIAANNITGTIPENIHFKYATEMFSGNNQLQGEFPIQFLQESRLLYRYFFFFNQFTELNVNHWPTDMKQARFDGSDFSQVLLDTHIERVPSLSHIDFTNTNVQGKIPVSLWNLPFINTIELTQNFLTGQLPQQRLPSFLEFIELERNQITGPIPEEIFASTLFRLSLSDNKLEGTIPNKISNLKRVYLLSLDKNEGLYGTIPTEFGTLRNLLEVTFDGTSLNGTVPIELCYLRDGKLSTLRSDCLVDTMTGIAQISCGDECCTSCCDSNGSGCIDYV